jgi:hypothetical protein
MDYRCCRLNLFPIQCLRFSGIKRAEKLLFQRLRRRGWRTTRDLLSEACPWVFGVRVSFGVGFEFFSNCIRGPLLLPEEPYQISTFK